MQKYIELNYYLKIALLESCLNLLGFMGTVQ
jgi:hypothetical protein